jgi:segregation and condensation protein B
MVEIEFKIEAILFVATEPVSLSQLAETIEASREDTHEAIIRLKAALKGTGLAIVEHDDAYRLVTAPELAPLLKKYMTGETKNELSRTALETLAIIAYRGPLTKSVIEEVRGVTSETMLKNLLQRGLIREAGSSKEPGRPTLYSVSHEFLQQFGLSNLSELPVLEEAVKES